ncbi:DUF6520 family protein [Galbibacter pacificus]|uniref:DUF6520 family protein n=1 Tax=Galbibacter pacificus TaxID=2996052 RepID=A0ABT6FUA6_9FLAO|nr:DUF6520 family protein [Galbibacter pacificus]MDG3583366.1 DUF6520 family protein [Galbibacter pacificus]MDG3586847.1 DUF6520 family protein [Galbibacter pacificus]
MKKRFKNLVMPMAVVVLAMGAAFAGNQISMGQAALADAPGYYWNEVQERCVDANTTCSTVFNLQQCSDGINDLSDSNCAQPLYVKIQ